MEFSFLEKSIQNLSDNIMGLSGYIENISVKPIYIYGAGCFGRELYTVLKNHNVNVAGFIDKNATNIIDAPINIYMPDNDIDKSDITVIIGIVMNKIDREELESFLHEKGYLNIIDGQSIRAHYVPVIGNLENISYKEYFLRQLPMIKLAYNLLSDNESKVTFLKNVKAHITRNYAEYYQTDGRVQYFVRDIPFTKGTNRFIDCGSYVGDTLMSLFSNVGNVEAIAAFEPGMQNFHRLIDNYAKEIKEHVKEIVFFPCGVAGVTELRGFSFAGGSSSINNTSSDMVQCVALDDVLPNFSPTFIKMDIEGMEYEALLGAKKIIGEYKPDLAISVYHCVEHFYTIINLINEWNYGYRFYMRTHSSCCMETILYAVCEKEE